MFEGLIERLILAYFGDYIENLDKNKLSLGLWSGILNLEDITIKSSSINKMKLPFKFIFGKIKKLSLNIPWKQNFSVPTVITVENIHIVLRVITKPNNWNYNNYNSFENKIYYLLKFGNEQIIQLSQAFSNNNNNENKNIANASGGGFFDRLVIKILDNLQVNFKNINIRIEDIYNNVSFGITLQEMYVENTNEKFEYEFIDRNVKSLKDVYKLLKISNCGFYLNPNEKYYISKYEIKDMESEMIKFFPEGCERVDKMEYLIEPMNLILKMKQRKNFENIQDENNPRLLLIINLETFDINVNKNQYDYFIKLLNTINKYQKILYDYNNTTKYKFFYPNKKLNEIKEENLNQNENNNEIDDSVIMNDESVIDILEERKKVKIVQNTYRHSIIMKWWKFAIQMIIYQIKYLKGNENIFNIPKILQEIYMKRFQKLFMIYFKEKKSNDNLISNKKESVLSQNELNEFKKIIEIIELKDLYLWSQPVLQTIFTETKQEEKLKKIKQDAMKNIIINIEGHESSNLITQEELEKIDEILTNSIKEKTDEIIYSDKETKLFIDFELNHVNLKFSKNSINNNNNNNIIEGFGIQCKRLFFNLKLGEFFKEVNSSILDFKIYMFTLINNSYISIPITYKEINEKLNLNMSLSNSSSSFSLSNQENNKEKPFLKLYLRKNNPEEEINFKLCLDINELNITYHQVFLQRIISFFSVKVNEDLADSYWEKINNVRIYTNQAIKNNMLKKNIIEIKIEPRKILIPINKYDIKNSKLLLVDLGKLDNKIPENFVINNEKEYLKNYYFFLNNISVCYFPSFNDMLQDKNKFNIINDISGHLIIKILNEEISPELFPNVKLQLNFDKIILNLNEYLYTTLIYIVDIFRPTKEIDLFSQINSSKNEIKENAKIFSKVLKKNYIYQYYEEFYAYLSAGYIYFYKNINDKDYFGYYYIKDCEIILNKKIPLYCKLVNYYGTLEMKFPNNEIFNDWLKNLQERLREMKISSINKKKEINIELKEQTIKPKNIYFGSEIYFNKIICNLYNKKSDIPFISGKVNNLKWLMYLREYDIDIKFSLDDIKLIDNLTDVEDFKIFATSEQIDFFNSNTNKKSKKLIDIDILICYEESDKYKDIQIDVKILLGNINIKWNPKVVRSLLGFLIYNDIMKYQVRKEISNTNENLINSNFLDPGKQENALKLNCKDNNYIYLNLNTHFETLNIILIQPILKIYFYEMKFTDSTIDIIMTEDHLIVNGFLSDAQLLDLSQYPFVIQDQTEFDVNKIQKIFAKSEQHKNKNLIEFTYKSMNNWCPEIKNNYTMESDIIINSSYLYFVYENFMRFFYYFINEFLGGLSYSEEVKNFKDKYYKILKKNEKDIDFMRLNMKINNPKIYLKPRLNFKEYFLLDLGNIEVNSFYQKLFGKLRKKPDEYRWNVTYQWIMKNIKITTEDNFNILNKADSIVNMHFIYYTESDKNLSDLEFDFSYQFDLFFGDMILNLRQRDYMNLLKCSDLNILYTDNHENDYDYTTFYNNFSCKNVNDNSKDNLNKINESNNKLKENNEELKNIYMSLITYVLFSKVSLIIYLDDLNNENNFIPFAEILIKETQLDFNKKLNNIKDTHIVIADLEINNLFYSENNSLNKDKIIEDFNSKKLKHSPYHQIKKFNSNIFEQRSSENSNEDFNIKIIEEKKTFRNTSKFLKKIGRKTSESSNFRKISSNSSNSKHSIDENLIEIFINNTLNNIKNCKIINIYTKLSEGTKINTDIKISVDNEREKDYKVELKNLKLLFKLDTLNLMRFFFMEGFPYYSKNFKDLPNFYDSNDENYPGYKFYIEFNNSIICFFTDQITNEEQEIVCITSDFKFEIMNEKVSRVKQILLDKFLELKNSKQFITDKNKFNSINKEIQNLKLQTWYLKFHLFNISPFVCIYKDVIENNDLITYKRKIMEEFNFSYESYVNLSYNENDSNFYIDYSENINMNKMSIKASYSDIIFYIKLGDFYYHLLDKKYVDNLENLKKYSNQKKFYENQEKLDKNKKEKQLLKQKIMNKYTKRRNSDFLYGEGLSENPIIKINSKIVDNNIIKKIFKNEGLEIVLIDNHSNILYPFLSIYFFSFLIDYSTYENEKNKILKTNFEFSIYSFNYYGGNWEPIIEKTSFTIESSTVNNYHTNISIKTNKSDNENNPDININVSDLTILFLNKTLKKWIEQFKRLKNNYKEEIYYINNNDNKNIVFSNHRIFNYTGRILNIYKRFGLNQKNKSKIIEILPNESYDLEYFESETNETNKNKNKVNYISFKVDNANVTNRIIKIDNVQNKIHRVDYNKIFEGKIKNVNNNPLNYIVSRIEFNNLKKHIYFYSPLCFKNKTKFNFIIDLRNKYEKKNLVINLSQNQTLGIPFEYLNGDLDIQLLNSKIHYTFPIKDFLTSELEIINEIKFSHNVDKIIYIHFQNQNNDKNFKSFKNKIIKIKTSYIIQNCLPFEIQIITNSSNDFFNIKKNEIISLENTSIYSSLSLKIFFYSFKTKNNVIIKENENSYLMTESDMDTSIDTESIIFKENKDKKIYKNIPILLYDDNNNCVTIFATLYKERKIIIYSNTILINHSNLNLYMNCGYDEKNVNKIVCNQKDHNNYYLMSNEKYILLRYNNYISKSIDINTLGTSTIIDLINTQNKTKIEIIMEIKLSLVSINLDLYTNIITLYPRFILYNKVKNYDFEVNIDKLQKLRVVNLLKYEEKQPFYYTNYFDSIIKFRPIPNDNNSSEYNYSNPYVTNSGTLTTLYSFKKIDIFSNKIEKLYFNIEKKIENLSTFLIIKECNIETCQISVLNYSNYVSFKLYQNNFEKESFYFYPKTKSIFAWNDITMKPILNFQFYYGDLRNNYINYYNKEYCFELTDQKINVMENKKIVYSENYPLDKYIYLKKDNYSGKNFNLKIEIDGNKIIIKITDIKKEDIIDIISNNYLGIKNTIEFNLQINRLGLSIIGDNRHLKTKKIYMRKELCYITFFNIILYIKKNEKNSGDLTREAQLIVKEIEIDNEIEYITNFPIIFLPENSNRIKELKEKDKKEKNENNKKNKEQNLPFLNLAIKLYSKPGDNLTRIELLNYLIQAFDINIDSKFLINVINFVNNLSKGLSISLTTINPLFLDDEILKKNNIEIEDFYYKPTWLMKNTNKNLESENLNEKNILYISQLEANSIEINLTFLSNFKDKFFQRVLQSNAVLAKFLSAIGNVEKVPLLLNGVELFNFYGTTSDLIMSIYEQYKQKMLVQIMKIFGGIEILGSPVNLINSLGKGFKDLVNKPKEGIMVSPLEGIVGLVDGGLSLAKHTVDGTFNTTSKMTSGISKGMLLVLQDDEYINEREKKKITEKPSNVIEGIAFGLSSFVGGVFNGLTDVVTKPIEGAKKNKDTLKGFGKGLLQGLGGAVIKPISGAFDLVSKTAEGVKNSVMDEIILERIRLPRPFYQNFKFIKRFKEKDMKILFLLNNKIEQLKGKNFDYYSSEIYKTPKGDSILLAFLGDGIHIIDIIRSEQKAMLEYSMIKEIKMESNEKIRLYFMKDINQKKSTLIHLNKTSTNGKKIYNKLKDIIDLIVEDRNINE